MPALAASCALTNSASDYASNILSARRLWGGFFMSERFPMKFIKWLLAACLVFIAPVAHAADKQYYQYNAAINLCDISNNAGTLYAGCYVPVDKSGNVITGSGGVAQGSTTSGQSGQLDMCATVTGDQTYTASTTNPLNCTASGRLKVGLSSASNIQPGALATGTTSGDLIDCQYNSGGITLSTTQTASCQFDGTGDIRTASANTSGALINPATSDNQATANTSLSSIATNTSSGAQRNVQGLTADGVSNTANPVMMGGTSDGTASGLSNIIKVDASGNQFSSVQGPDAVGASVTAKPITTGCLFNTTPATITNGQVGALQCTATQQLGTALMRSDGVVAGINNSGAVLSVGTFGLDTNSAGFIYNGSTNDPIVSSVRAASLGTGVGTVATGQFCKYNATSTSWTDGQYAPCQSGTNGALITRPFATASNEWSYAAASGGISNTTTAVTIKAANASFKNCITSIQLSAGALGAATEIAIRDGAGGTVVWRGYLSTAGLAGQNTQFDVPICNASTNTLLEVVTLTATITGAVYVNAQGFVTP